MADPALVLTRIVRQAFADVLQLPPNEVDPLLRPSDHADYQANAAMALGKRVGRPPREIAVEVASVLEARDELASVEVAGPGFLNLTLSDAFVASLAAEALADASGRLGVGTAEQPLTVVVDYSSPNVAKEMHVGHLRSTVIGDSLVRLLEFAGHTVIRQNHLGDWGTQFGMLIEHLGETDAAGREISDLNELYQEAKRRFDSEPDFAERARARVVQLQSGDEETLALWRALVAESERHFEQLYALLGVKLTHDDVRGESFYNDLLEPTVEELESKGLVKLDDGALCAFPPGFAGRDGEPLPLIVRKSDGGFGYAATDLAAVRFRACELGADWIVYVVDARQSQHFGMLFAIAQQAGWLGASGGPVAQHVAFGTILGPDNRPFKTREGGTVRLSELLDEAVQRAAAAVAEKNPSLAESERSDIADAVGIGAIKYADLSSDRVKDYVFDWERMLSFDGNTAPYLQYAHARIQSILRRAEVGPADRPAPIVLGEPAERELALQLLSFESNVVAAVEGLQPHRLCTYLFSLASAFTSFYEACPVLRAESEEVRGSRLALCRLTAQTLAVGLDLLGIAAPDRM